MKPLTWYKAAIAVLLPLCAAFHAASGQTLELSFQQALELAQKNNPQILQAKVGLEKAEAQIGEAYSAALPTLSASAYYQRNFIIPELVTEFAGETVTIRFSQENLFTGEVSLTQPLYAAGRVGLALKIARLYHQIAEEDLSVSASQVRLSITQLYFGAQLAAQWEKVAQETYQQMQQHLAQVQVMQKEGLVSEYDLIRSQVQVSNFFPQVINSASQRQTAFEMLNIALGLPQNQALALTDGLEQYAASQPPAENLFNLALQKRGELRQLNIQTSIMQKLTTIEQHGLWWPTLALVGAYTTTAQEPDFKFENYYWSNNLYAGLALSFPLFDGFKASHRVQQVRADLKSLDIQKDQLERGINLEIIQAQNKFAEAQKNVAAQEEGVSLARKGFEIAEVQYRNGLATQVEVMDAQIALNEARVNELFARYDLISSQAELEKALGE